MIKSQAWKDALENKNEPRTSINTNFYASTEDAGFSDETTFTSHSAELFLTEYTNLVYRAYAKIIAEAEAADARLEREYNLRNASNQSVSHNGVKRQRQELELVNKRFHAHRAMLEGLKSWDVFSEYGTDDLDFFKEENKNKVYEMYQRGENQSTIVNYLVYKLADLYHFEN
ncbi:MAG: hypothetical protein MUO53_14700 [Maribacter sp.]|nr:hypothetical protein [Maribacter sp.]